MKTGISGAVTARIAAASQSRGIVQARIISGASAASTACGR